MGLASLGAVLSDASPTNHQVVDVVLRVTFVAFVTAAAARGRREAVLVAAALAAIGGAGDPASTGLSFAGLGIALASTTGRRRSRLLNALAGALVANSLLHLVWPTTSRGTALLAALASSILAASALRRMRDGERRRALAAGALLGGAMLMITATAGVTILQQRGELSEARDQLEAGVHAARQGEADAAAAHLRDASLAVDRAIVRLDAWWMQPARGVPIVAQHVSAAHRTLISVRETADALVAASESLHLETIRAPSGVIDIDALRAAQPLVERTVRTVAQVRATIQHVRSPWLVPPLHDALDELSLEATQAEGDARSVQAALAVVPRVIGADGPRQWLLLVATPAELRGGGGFVGNWAVLRADRGRITLPIVERSRTVEEAAPFEVAVDPEYDATYVSRWGLDRFFRNVTASPHLPSTAAAAVQMVEPLGLGEFDGVLVVDPYAIAGLLRLTGPVSVDWWPVPITARNAPRILLHDQYERARDSERHDFLEDVTRVTFDRVLTGPLPSFGRIAAVVGPLARQGRFQLHAFDPEVDRWIRRIGASSDLVQPDGDGFGVVNADRVASKLDYFLRRTVTYHVTVDPRTGHATGELTVAVANLAGNDLPTNGYFGRDTDGEPGVGTTLQSQALYSMLTVTAIELDGDALGGVGLRERGYNIVESFFPVAPGQRRELRYELSGTVPLVDGRYQLHVHRQPTVAPDRLVVVVNGDTVFDGEQDQDLSIEVDLESD